MNRARTSRSVLAAAAFIGACAQVPESRSVDSAGVADPAAEEREPLIVEDEDGTVTIRRAPADGAERPGLVIEPQVVTPPLPRRDRQ